jgi:hypothetical protein
MKTFFFSVLLLMKTETNLLIGQTSQKVKLFFSCVSLCCHHYLVQIDSTISLLFLVGVGGSRGHVDLFGLKVRTFWLEMTQILDF